jgi:hypothetical protein
MNDEIKLLRILLSAVRERASTKEMREDLLDVIEAVVENRFIKAKWSAENPPELYHILRDIFPGPSHPIWNHIPIFKEDSHGG